jgi:hypothetical protein
MNFFEAQEFFKKMYPDKLVTFDFDDTCIRQIECIYTDGQLHPMNHVEYNRVKATPLGMASTYIPIAPHRAIVTAATVKAKIPKDDVHMHPDTAKAFNDLKGKPDYDVKMQEHMAITGMTKAQIESKL